MNLITGITTRRRRLRAYLCTGIALLLSLVIADLALAASFGCELCHATSGPNQTMHYVEGINYNSYEVIDRIWKYNGGSNYNVVGEAYTTSSYKLFIGDECDCNITGHGEVTIFQTSSHLAGKDET